MRGVTTSSRNLNKTNKKIVRVVLDNVLSGSPAAVALEENLSDAR
jgi:hypothetical protein